MKSHELAAFKDLRKILEAESKRYHDMSDEAEEKEDEEMQDYFLGKSNGLAYASILLERTFDICDLPYEDDEEISKKDDSSFIDDQDWLGK